MAGLLLSRSAFQPKYYTIYLGFLSIISHKYESFRADFLNVSDLLVIPSDRRESRDLNHVNIANNSHFCRIAHDFLVIFANIIQLYK